MIDPTPEQIEAAYQAWINYPHKRGPQNAENAIKAALVAAAGAAPQEPGRNRTPSFSERLELIASAWNTYRNAYAGPQEPPAWFGAGFTLGLSRGSEFAVPVQVDEAKLADVIEHAGTDWQFQFEASEETRAYPDPGPKADFMARAVAEWLRGGEQ